MKNRNNENQQLIEYRIYSISMKITVRINSDIKQKQKSKS